MNEYRRRYDLLNGRERNLVNLMRARRWTQCWGQLADPKKVEGSMLLAKIDQLIANYSKVTNLDMANPRIIEAERDMLDHETSVVMESSHYLQYDGKHDPYARRVLHMTHKLVHPIGEELRRDLDTDNPRPAEYVQMMGDIDIITSTIRGIGNR